MQVKKIRVSENRMKELSELTGLIFDGDDNRLFGDEMNVDVLKMTEAEYAQMEKTLANFNVKGNGFTVYAWNDSSGYDYWLEESKNYSFNYIQVTVIVESESVDVNELINGFNRARDYFLTFENA